MRLYIKICDKPERGYIACHHLPCYYDKTSYKLFHSASYLQPFCFMYVSESHMFRFTSFKPVHLGQPVTLNITLLKNLSFPVQFTGSSLSCGFICGDLINSQPNLCSECSTFGFLTSFYTFDVFLILPKVPTSLILERAMHKILIFDCGKRTHLIHFLFLSTLWTSLHIVYLTLIRRKVSRVY